MTEFDFTKLLAAIGVGLFILSIMRFLGAGMTAEEFLQRRFGYKPEHSE